NSVRRLRLFSLEAFSSATPLNESVPSLFCIDRAVAVLVSSRIRFCKHCPLSFLDQNNL
ncbi:hypothetical protein L9F63_001580, partial [Diploptera punctata]